MDDIKVKKILQVKQVTRLGIVYCVKALTENDWDVNKAIKYAHDTNLGKLQAL